MNGTEVHRLIRIEFLQMKYATSHEAYLYHDIYYHMDHTLNIYAWTHTHIKFIYIRETLVVAYDSIRSNLNL